MADSTATVYILGQDPSCDMVIDDEYASPRHAVVVRQDGVTKIADLGSTNGTWLRHGGPERGWTRVYGPTPMQPGDQVRIGRTVIPWTGASEHG